MNIRNPQLPPQKNDSEELFDDILFYRRLASLLVEQLQITKELEQLLPEDQAKFTQYLTDTIFRYETECGLVLDAVEDDLPEELQGANYDKNTTLTQYLYSKQILILTYLNDIKKIWNDKKLEEITALLKETHNKNVSFIFDAKKRVENNFSLLENMTMEAMGDSSDNQKNETLKKSLDEMRQNLKNDGFDV
jgi:hypothetical protein